MSALEGYPAIRSVRLVGSRERGDAKELSDWDFAVETDDFQAVARAIPALVASLRPLAQQWDRLSQWGTYMLILPGAAKVDLLFNHEHTLEPPWEVGAETLEGVDSHFWDWILWLAAKHFSGKYELVRPEFAKMSAHLLRPMGVAETPHSIENAIELYTAAREALEKRFRVHVRRILEREVRRTLRRSGYNV